MKRKWEIEDKEVYQRCIDEILQRIKDQGDADFGHIAASDIIAIVSESLGPMVYNKALKDAQKIIDNNFADLNVNIDALKQQRSKF